MLDTKTKVNMSEEYPIRGRCLGGDQARKSGNNGNYRLDRNL